MIRLIKRLCYVAIIVLLFFLAMLFTRNNATELVIDFWVWQTPPVYAGVWFIIIFVAGMTLTAIPWAIQRSFYRHSVTSLKRKLAAANTLKEPLINSMMGETEKKR